MASALLDDTTNHSVSMSDHDLSKSQDMSTREKIPSALNTNDPVLLDVECTIPNDRQPCTGRPLKLDNAQQLSNQSQRKFLRNLGTLTRAASTRPVVNSPLDWKPSSSKRPVSHLNGPLLHTTRIDGLKKSCTVPLTKVLGENKASGSSTDPDNLQARNGAEDIERKVSAMLAATDALKPSRARMSEAHPCRRSRNVGSKVIEKMTNVFDRLASKNLEPELTLNASPTSPRSCDQVGRVRMPELKDDGEHQNVISTIEIRLNEGDNLNRQKVQRIVGGHVTRKPVADDGKSLRTGPSIDDPFSEVGRPRTNPQIVKKNQKLFLDDQDIMSLTPEKYFESERGFYDDIDDGILSTIPVGSSTPRSRQTRLSTTSYDASPTHDSVETVGLPQVAVTVALSKPTVNFEIRGLKSDSDKSREKRLLDVEGQCWLNPPITTTSADAKGCKRVKKHPSPSKMDLEDLRIALRDYTIFRSSTNSEDDLDELAKVCDARTQHLAPRDANQRMVSSTFSTGQLGGGQSSLPTPWASLHDLRTPQSTFYHGNRQSKLAASRLAIPYRPPIPCSNEVDELH